MWHVIAEMIIDNQLLKNVVQITNHMLVQINEGKGTSGFDLMTLPNLFEVKSTHTKEKSAYHFVMKMHLLYKTGNN